MIRGVGIGLRWQFADQLLDESPALDFLEVSPENYIGRGGKFAEHLERATEMYPIVTHGLTMSIGGHDPIDASYLRTLRDFIARVKSPWHSDHLCFGSVDGVRLHDLLPIAFQKSEVARIADRIRHVQDAIAVPFAIENISFYVHPGKQEMSEAEFVAELCEKAQCSLMLDVNNAYVNACNFGFDVDEWMRVAPLDRVVQMHIAGHESWEEEGESMLIDTHGAPVCDPVKELLKRVLPRVANAPVLLERDESIPPLRELLSEANELKEMCEMVWRDNGIA